MPRSLAQRFDPELGPKRLLALDGGGVKGVLTLGLLKALESELRRRSGDPNFVLADYYDLIGGTSTGGIIAAGLALGVSVDSLIDMYLDLGPRVFGRSTGDGSIFRSKFDSRALRRALEPVLGRKTLGSPDLRTGFAIHAKRIDTGSAWVITNNPKSKYFEPPADSGLVANKRYRLIDLVLASAAAPTFFDEVVIPIEYDDRDRVVQRAFFVDGAVGANNNPSMQMLMLALLKGYGFAWKSGAKNLMMTSFGTGLRRPEVDGDEFHAKAPALRGVDSLRSMIYDTQVQGIMLLQALSDPAMPWRINSELGDMAGDRVTPEALLDFQRIDVRLDRKPPQGRRRRGEPPVLTFVEEVLGRELSASVLDQLDDMANGKPANMKLLLEIGEAAGPRFANAKYPSQAFDLPDWSSWSLAS